MMLFFIKLQRKFDGKPIRERLLLLLAVWSIILYVGIEHFILPRKAILDRLESEQSQLENQNRQIEQKISELEIKLAATVDPNKLKKQRLLNELKQYDKKLLDFQYLLVSSKDMAKLLHTILRNAESVVITSLKNLPTEEIDLSKKEIELELDSIDEGSIQKIKQTTYYRHGISLELNGDYFGVLNYLKKIERMQWKFYWESLEYTVTEYPNATVKINLYRYSRDPNWVSV